MLTYLFCSSVQNFRKQEPLVLVQRGPNLQILALPVVKPVSEWRVFTVSAHSSNLLTISYKMAGEAYRLASEKGKQKERRF